MIEKTNSRAPGSIGKQLLIDAVTRAGTWRGREAGRKGEGYFSQMPQPSGVNTQATIPRELLEPSAPLHIL